MPTVDPNQFKHAMSRWGSGVTVITVKAGEVVHGMTASAFCSVSIDPTLVLVCIGKKQGSHKLLKDAGRFVINLLAEDQHTLSDYFAKPRPEGKAQFDTIPHSLTTSGEPVLSGVLTVLECKVWSVADGGDHDIFVGEVTEVEFEDGRPLVFFKGGYALPA